MANNVLFKTTLLKGPQGDRGDIGEADAVPVDGVIAYDGEDVPEGYEETDEPPVLEELVETVGDLEEAVGQNTIDIATQTARIDQIASLPSGSTSGDAELQDIRVGYDGKTYTNAGTAVRTCDQTLQDQFSGTSYTKTGGSGNQTFSVYIPKGTKWSYTNNGSNSQTLVATYSDTTTATLRSDLPAGSTYNGVAAKTITKVGGWYNANANFTITIYGINERLTDTQAEVATLSGQVSTSTSDITEAKVDIATLEGYYYTVPTTRNLLNPATIKPDSTLSATGEVTSGSYYTSDFIEVKASSAYYLSKNAASYTWYRVCVYDENKDFLSKSDYQSHLTIPSSGKYIRICAVDDISITSNKYQLQINGVSAYVAYDDITVISNKVAGYVTPEMFGAAGNNETDDKDAIQECFNYAVANNMPVYFRKTTYKIESGITVPTNLYLDGNGATISAKGYFAAFNLTDCVVTIKNLKFVGLGNMSATDNKAIKGAFFFSTFDNIWIEGFYRGIDLTGASVDHSLVENRLINITVYDCYQCIKLGDNDGNARGTDGTLENVNIRCNNSEYGLQINTGSGWKINNVHVFGEVATAIFVVNAYACDISNIYIEYFTDHGLFINTQGNVNVNNMSIFIDEQNSDCIYVEKSGWTTTSNVFVNLANIDVWVKASAACYFLRGTNCYVNLVNYSKRGNVSNITDNGLNSADYVKVAQYATL
jgi:hypothetical protein